MIKDETLWMAENNLEQLWAEETAQEQSKRMEDLAEVNGDSEEYIEEEGDEGGKEGKQQLGAIGSSKPRTPGRETASPPSTEEIGDTAVRLGLQRPVLQNEVYSTALTNIFR